MPVFALSERDRRWSRIRESMAAEGISTLISPAADARGGWVRYLAGSADLAADGVILVGLTTPPELLVTQNVGLDGDRGWIDRVTVTADLEGEVEHRIGAGDEGRVAVVPPGSLPEGLGRLARSHDFADAGSELARCRAEKSAPETAAVREAAWIADRCFELLLERAEPGLSPWQLRADLTQRALSLGARSLRVSTRRSAPALGSRTAVSMTAPPTDEALSASDTCYLCLEVSGPAGYRAVLGRPVAFIAPDEPSERVARAATTAVDALVRRAAPRESTQDLHAVAADAAATEGTTLVGPAGWGIGAGAYEWPVLDATTNHRIGPDHILAVSCHVIDDETGMEGSVADTVLVGSDTGRRLSEFPVGTFHPQHWRNR